MKEWTRCIDALPDKNKLVMVRDKKGELSHGKIVGEAHDKRHLLYDRHFQKICRETKYITFDCEWMYLSDYFKPE